MVEIINFIDFFAGIGGFSLGLERAGLKCVGQVEPLYQAQTHRLRKETKARSLDRDTQEPGDKEF